MGTPTGQDSPRGDHDRDALRVKHGGLSFANVRVARDGDATTFRVHGGGFIFGRTAKQFGIARTVLHHGSHRRVALTLLAVSCLLLVGCASIGNRAAAPTSSRAPTATPSATPFPASSTAETAPSGPSTLPSTNSPVISKVPVLGLGRYPTRGYGSVRPAIIDNGGDPTGIVTDVTWRTWGGPQAIATGMGYYDPPNVPASRSIKERTTVVAFDLGTCSGRYMYQAIEWYFPESGGSFDPGNYINICSWTYSKNNR